MDVVGVSGAAADAAMRVPTFLGRVGSTPPIAHTWQTSDASAVRRRPYRSCCPPTTSTFRIERRHPASGPSAMGFSLRPSASSAVKQRSLAAVRQDTPYVTS